MNQTEQENRQAGYTRNFMRAAKRSAASLVLATVAGISGYAASSSFETVEDTSKTEVIVNNGKATVIKKTTEVSTPATYGYGLAAVASGLGALFAFGAAIQSGYRAADHKDGRFLYKTDPGEADPGLVLESE